MFGNSSELFGSSSQTFRNSSGDFMNRSGILTETSNKEAEATPNTYVLHIFLFDLNLCIVVLSFARGNGSQCILSLWEHRIGM